MDTSSFIITLFFKYVYAYVLYLQREVLPSLKEKKLDYLGAIVYTAIPESEKRMARKVKMVLFLQIFRLNKWNCLVIEFWRFTTWKSSICKLFFFLTVWVIFWFGRKNEFPWKFASFLASKHMSSCDLSLWHNWRCFSSSKFNDNS